MYQNKKKFGFTLAETLITLTILGVVAALTIPGLKKFSQREIVGGQLKKAYMTLNAALDYVISEDMKLDIAGMGGSDFFIDYIVPKLAIAKSCNTDNMSECFVTSDAAFATPDYAVVLNSDITIAVSGLFYYIDVNGTQEPNREGVDIFMYSLSQDADADTPEGAAQSVANTAGWTFNPVGKSVNVMNNNWRIDYW